MTAAQSGGKVVHGRELLPESITKLLAGCPLYNGNPTHCPLHDVRELPSQEALRWLASLSTEEKAYLLQYHRCCQSLGAEKMHEAANAARHAAERKTQRK